MDSCHPNPSSLEYIWQILGENGSAFWGISDILKINIRPLSTHNSIALPVLIEWGHDMGLIGK